MATWNENSLAERILKHLDDIGADEGLKPIGQFLDNLDESQDAIEIAMASLTERREAIFNVGTGPNSTSSPRGWKVDGRITTRGLRRTRGWYEAKAREEEEKSRERGWRNIARAIVFSGALVGSGDIASSVIETIGNDRPSGSIETVSELQPLENGNNASWPSGRTDGTGLELDGGRDSLKGEDPPK
jgi:hypothetical protein